MPVATPKRLAKRVETITVELTAPELALLPDIMFRAVVACMMELNEYTRRGQNGSDFQRETVRELNHLKSIQAKIDHASMRIP